MIPKPQDPCSTCQFWKVSHHISRKPYFETFEGMGFCNPEGTPLLGVSFMSEASGNWEEQDGLPLRSYAQAGSIHTRVLRSLYVSRKQIMAFNTLACRPPNNELDGMPYEMDVIAHCAPIRNARIEAFRQSVEANPNIKQGVIVALGDTAFSTLTGLRGDYRSISYARGYPVKLANGLVVLGTWHPAYVRRNTKLMGTLTHDYRRAFEIARDGFTEYPRSYTLRPNEDQIRDFRDRVLALPADQIEHALMYDIESPFIDKTRKIGPNNPDRILSVQFSLEPGKGIFIDMNGDTRPVVKEILASKCAKVSFNGWDFDDLVVAFQGMPLGGISHDALWMQHHKDPDLVMEDAGTESDADFRFSTSASLQSVSSYYGGDFMWKHLRGATSDEEIRFYGVADVDHLARIIMLGEPGQGSLPTQMKNLGIWNGYDRFVRLYNPVLRKAAERGIPINRKMQHSFAIELEGIEREVDKAVQLAHPDELKRISPPKGFVNGPKISDKLRWDEAGQFFEWYDEADDVTEERPSGEADDPEVPVVSGVWRKMVQRSFIEPEVKEKTHCECLHDPQNCERDCCLGKPTKKGTRTRKKGLEALDGKRADLICSICSGKGTRTIVRSNVESIRWARLLPFRPSNKQLVDYIEFRGHRVPTEKGKKTTAAKGIQELAKKHKEDRLYQSILDIRTVGKIRSTYVVGKGWVNRQYKPNGKHNHKGEPQYDELPIDWNNQPDRIHTTFTMRPATGQTSSVFPNVQNGPKHIRNENLRSYDLPTRWRTMIQARPGRRIWEFDLKSAHALTLGLNARDASYMRLARMDVHTYFTSVLASKQGLWPRPIDLNVSDVDLKAALKECRAYVTPGGLSFEKDIRDVRAKSAILGVGFGMMGKKLFNTNKESFNDEADAQNVIDTVFVAFPKLKVYQDDVIAEAHDKKYLISRGGFIRWFWHVYDFKYDQFNQESFRVGHGDDAEDAKAFRPANDAFVYMRDAGIRMEELGINHDALFINTIHDSNVFEPEQKSRPIIIVPEFAASVGMRFHAILGTKDRDEELAHLIKKEMERPQLLLADKEVAPEGLVIECEASCGNDFGHLKKVNI